MKSIIILFISIMTTMTVQGQEQTNRHFWNSVETTASADEIWSIWMDVPNWKNWDVGLKDAIADDPIALHSIGKIISLEGRASKFKVVAFEKGKSYTFKTNLPLGGLYVKRSLEVKSGKTYFTHEVWFKGITAGIFARNFGKKFRSMLPEAMNKIKKIVENDRH